MTNILAAPLLRGPIHPGPPPAIAGTPRETWDRQPPAASTVQDWATAQFVNLPEEAWFTPRSQRHPVAVPGLPPWTGGQALSARERRWILAPIIRSVPFCGFSRSEQLAVRTQLREAILVTRAGRRPPAGSECNACRDPSASLPFAACISGGIGERCNNCLFRGHVQCSLQG
jgi:hypothetical protein